MLRLTIDVIADMGYIDFAWANGGGVESVGSVGSVGSACSKASFPVPGAETEGIPIISIDYGSDDRIVGIEIPNPSCSLSGRFKACEDNALFPIYMTVDTTTDIARIPFRETSLEVRYDRNNWIANIKMKELPAEMATTIERGPIAVHFNEEGRISAITISDISNQLKDCFRTSKADER
jgi:uncharacterized protein YuzE